MFSDPLGVVAAIGSVSYGPLEPQRLRALLTSEAPLERGESARLRQAAMDSDPNLLASLALTLGITLPELSRRLQRRIGARLEEVNPWMRGDLF
jgi:hypothetical protein